MSGLDRITVVVTNLITQLKQFVKARVRPQLTDSVVEGRIY